MTDYSTVEKWIIFIFICSGLTILFLGIFSEDKRWTLKVKVEFKILLLGGLPGIESSHSVGEL